MLFVFCAALAAQAADAPAAKPTADQAAWQDLELGMFIHFAPNTWSDREDDDLSVAPAKINPEQLNTDEWAAAAAGMGAKYVIFVAKHVGGFCWWPTETTDYSVASAAWRGGKGDVLRDLAASCKKLNLKLGVYLSPADKKHGAEGGGKCKTDAEQKIYEELYKKQLTEVLSQYGEMCEVWFDGSLIFDVSDIVNKYAPHAAVFQSRKPTIRWVGNEDGVAPNPAWNAVNIKNPPSQYGVFTAADGNPEGDFWLPNECDCRIRDTWFWNSKNEKSLKSTDALVKIYEQSVGRGAQMLLNMTPDTTGRIPTGDVKRAAEFGAEIARRFGRNLGSTRGNGNIVVLNMNSPAPVDAVSIMENISEGERVREYAVDAYINNDWKEVAKGTAIGHKKIEAFPEVTTAMLRLRVNATHGEPRIRAFAAHRARAVDNAQIAQSLKRAQLQILSPLDYQVFQRQTPAQGIIRIAGNTTLAADTVEARLLQSGGSGSEVYTTIAVDPVLHSFAGDLLSPAGGWYPLEIRVKNGEEILDKKIVEHVGVGEVFIGAGQSNSTNSGGEGLLNIQTTFVSTFSGFDWRLANDPQPGVHDRSGGGSFWPAFGDAMYNRYHVPIGLAVTGHGGTSIRQWQYGGEIFLWFMTRSLQFGPRGFRAVLWHQGESDVDMSVEQYATGMAQIINDSRKLAGWEIPWFVARVSYHNPQRPSHDSTRNAQKILWDTGVAFEGPDTDALMGDNRDGGGNGIHFSPKGLKAHGQAWADKIIIYLDKLSGNR